MAKLTVTAANVERLVDTATTRAQFGEAVNAGESVYKSTDNKWYLAQADGTALQAGSGGLGVALTNAAAADGYGFVATEGLYDPGATTVEGTIYILGADFGGIYPAADQVSTWFGSIVGVGAESNNLYLKPFASGEARP